MHSAEKNIAQPCIEIKSIMKKDIHPEDYRMVVFKDMTNDYSFLGKSCADTKETMKWEDGNEYPLVKLDISHKSLVSQKSEKLIFTSFSSNSLSNFQNLHLNTLPLKSHSIDALHHKDFHHSASS